MTPPRHRRTANKGRSSRRHREAPTTSDDAPDRRRPRLRAAVITVLAISVAVIATGARALAEPLPPPTVARIGPLSVIVPGAPLRLPWPTQGEAALVTTAGLSLGRSGSTAAVPIASLTKVMTAYVIVADHPLPAGQVGPDLTITPAEAAQLSAQLREGQSVLIVHAGERLSERQALQALLIPSANNIAAALARFDAGTPGAFTAKMNATALHLGMVHTHYAGPSGYNPASTSTPGDQLLLARAALGVPTLAAIVAEPAVTLPGVGTVANYNTLAGHDGYQGIKTGSTAAAGGCLLYAVIRNIAGTPVTFLGAVLGQRHGPYIAAAIDSARALTDAAFAALYPRTVLPAGTPVLDIGQAGQHTIAITSTALTTIDPPGTLATVALTVSRSPANLARDQPIATITLHAAGTTSTGAVRIATPLPPPTLTWRLIHLL